VKAGGQMSVAYRLPGDSMGSILDSRDLTTRIATALRLAGQLDVSTASKFAIAVGLSTSSMVSVGQISQTARSRVSMSMTESAVKVEPDEAISRTALDRGADEVAASLSRSLIRQFENRMP